MRVGLIMNKKSTSFLAGAKDTIAIIIIAVLCIYALLANSNSAGKSSLPMSFGIGGALVATGSMEPELPTDSYILVKAQKSYAVGDVVAYISERVVVVHRITAINGNMITTKGDANNIEDPEFPAENIKGKVVFHIPGAGKFIRLIKSPFGGMLLIFIAFSFLIFSKKRSEDEDEGEPAGTESEKSIKENAAEEGGASEENEKGE